jgi:hypothetical protein
MCDDKRPISARIIAETFCVTIAAMIAAIVAALTAQEAGAIIGPEPLLRKNPQENE